MVQGANDPRVNINESDQIVTALRAKGFDVPYMVKYNEGHGFQREENRMDFFAAPCWDSLPSIWNSSDAQHYHGLTNTVSSKQQKPLAAYWLQPGLLLLNRWIIKNLQTPQTLQIVNCQLSIVNT